MRHGPAVWKVSGSAGLVCPVAASAGSPTATAALTYRFPRRSFVEALLIVPRPNVAFSSLAAQLGALAVAIVDENIQPIVSDSRATALGSNGVPPAAGLLALFGRGFRPFKLQRPVLASDAWSFTVQNADPVNAQTLDGIYLYFREATK